MDVSYSQLQRLIYDLTHQFQRRYGGDWDELVSEAHEHYSRALTTYDSTRAKITTHIGYRIWKGLLETARTKGRRGRLLQQIDMDLGTWREKGQFNPRMFLSELSNDAALVVSLVWAAERKPGKRRVIRHLLSLGWAAERVLESFREIREALR